MPNLNSINHIARIGFVTASPSELGNVQKLQIQLNNVETTDGVNSFGMYGLSSSPLIGAAAMVLNIAGDNSNGTVIATNDGRYRPQGMTSGEVQLYDNNGQAIYLSTQGGVMAIRIQGNQEVSISANVGVTINTPVTTVTGNLVVATGATGSFPTASGLTVTVQDGIITNII